MSEIETSQDHVQRITIITVDPFGEGWAVRYPGVEYPSLFRSGARAEEAARRVANRIGRAGEWAEVRITLRDGSRAARFVCAPKFGVQWEKVRGRS